MASKKPDPDAQYLSEPDIDLLWLLRAADSGAGSLSTMAGFLDAREAGLVGTSHEGLGSRLRPPGQAKLRQLEARLADGEWRPRRSNNPGSVRKYKSKGHVKENPMRKYKSEEGAREYAEEMGLAYGFSTFDDGWFVGSPRELEDIGVFLHHLPSPESRTRAPRQNNPTPTTSDLVRRLKF